MTNLQYWTLQYSEESQWLKNYCILSKWLLKLNHSNESSIWKSCKCAQDWMILQYSKVIFTKISQINCSDFSLYIARWKCCEMSFSLVIICFDWAWLNLTWTHMFSVFLRKTYFTSLFRLMRYTPNINVLRNFYAFNALS